MIERRQGYGVSVRHLVFGLLVVASGGNRVVVARAGDCSGSMQTFRATAYTVEGETAGGTDTKEGIVAADPRVLPLGSKIRICDAGEYSGMFVVKDKGRKIHGHKIDVYLENAHQAKRFGKRSVKVDVLEYGDGTRAAAKAAPLPPKSQKAPAIR